MDRQRPNLGDRLVPSANHNGFPMLDFFEIVREMGFGFMYVDLYHGYIVDQVDD